MSSNALLHAKILSEEATEDLLEEVLAYLRLLQELGGRGSVRYRQEEGEEGGFRLVFRVALPEEGLSPYPRGILEGEVSPGLLLLYHQRIPLFENHPLQAHLLALKGGGLRLRPRLLLRPDIPWDAEEYQIFREADGKRPSSAWLEYLGLRPPDPYADVAYEALYLIEERTPDIEAVQVEEYPYPWGFLLLKDATLFPRLPQILMEVIGSLLQERGEEFFPERMGYPMVNKRLEDEEGLLAEVSFPNLPPPGGVWRDPSWRGA